MATVQDYGRFGYQKYGVAQSGPIDIHAFCWANYLLGNHFNTAQIEITQGGFTAVFNKSTNVAICGADLDARINNCRIKPWQNYKIVKNDKITFDRPKNGAFCYLAVSGGFNVKHQLASCSSLVKEKLGGLHCNGQPLVKGDELNYSPDKNFVKRKVPENYVPNYSLPVLELGYFPNKFLDLKNKKVAKAIKKFEGTTYLLSNKINRMGYFLEGQTLDLDQPEVVSHGLSLGSIQLPKDGQPIVLMQDKQTIGGYPVLGCVAYLELKNLAQSLPKQKIKFKPIEFQAATNNLIKHLEFFGISLDKTYSN